MPMIRTQVQLTQQQFAALKGLSRVENVSMAELIRRAVDLAIGSSPIPSRELRKQRALAVAGKFSSGSSDVSIRHDEYLTDLYAK
jgi:hypothetical protein